MDTSKIKILVVEDDFISRRILVAFLDKYGDCEIAVDGNEAVAAVRMSEENSEPYDLICLDIMMPKMNGQDTLKAIRKLESESRNPRDKQSKIIMTTALSDPANVIEAFRELCDGYLVKPIAREHVIQELKRLNLIDTNEEEAGITTQQERHASDTSL